MPAPTNGSRATPSARSAEGAGRASPADGGLLHQPGEGPQPPHRRGSQAGRRLPCAHRGDGVGAAVAGRAEVEVEQRAQARPSSLPSVRWARQVLDDARNRGASAGPAAATRTARARLSCSPKWWLSCDANTTSTSPSPSGSRSASTTRCSRRPARSRGTPSARAASTAGARSITVACSWGSRRSSAAAKSPWPPPRSIRRRAPRGTGVRRATSSAETAATARRPRWYRIQASWTAPPAAAATGSDAEADEASEAATEPATAIGAPSATTGSTRAAAAAPCMPTAAPLRT